MIKIVCAISLLLSLPLLASEQLLLVTAADMEQSGGTLQRYDRCGERYCKTGSVITVNLGRNGLGWGLGLPFEHPAADPIKHEGDGRAPAGLFALRGVFGDAPLADTRMPYRQSTPDLICVDDTASKAYNRMVPVSEAGAVKSFEWMRRDDALYRLGVTVAHNEAQLPGRGSCIFLHLQKAPGSPTSGCTSMAAEALRSVTAWLDPAAEPLLVQVPFDACGAVEARFPGVECLPR